MRYDGNGGSQGKIAAITGVKQTTINCKCGQAIMAIQKSNF